MHTISGGQCYNCIMAGLAERREKVARNMRRQHRQEIFSGMRAAMMEQAERAEWPIVSEVLEDFMECNRGQLMMQSEEIRETIQFCHIEDLTDEQQEELVNDLFFLIQEDILAPFEIRFKRNESPYVACIVAFLSVQMPQEELEYWINFMDPESKALAFLSIPEDERSHQKWFNSQKLFKELLSSLDEIKEAAQAMRDYLIDSEGFTKKHADASVQYIHKAIWRVRDPEHRGILLQIWMQLSLMMSRTPGESLKAQTMLDEVNSVLKDDHLLLAEGSTVEELNLLYEFASRDYLGDERVVLQLLQHWIKRAEAQRESEDSNVYRLYVMKLCLNNWRAKQLTHKGYCYSPRFYELLARLHNGRSQNTYYQRLMGLQK